MVFKDILFTALVPHLQGFPTSLQKVAVIAVGHDNTYAQMERPCRSTGYAVTLQVLKGKNGWDVVIEPNYIQSQWLTSNAQLWVNVATSLQMYFKWPTNQEVK